MVRAVLIDSDVISVAQGVLDRKQRVLEERNAQLLKHFDHQECFLCMGSEGPAHPDNCELLVCGHVAHELCKVRMRVSLIQSVREALMPREGGVLRNDIPTSRVVHGTECGMCRAPIVRHGAVGPAIGHPEPNLVDVVPPLKRMPQLMREVRDRKDALAKQEATYAEMRSILDKTYSKHLSTSQESSPCAMQ